jgi:hypothetical protein
MEAAVRYQWLSSSPTFFSDDALFQNSRSALKAGGGSGLAPQSLAANTSVADIFVKGLALGDGGILSAGESKNGRQWFSDRRRPFRA